MVVVVVVVHLSVNIIPGTSEGKKEQRREENVEIVRCLDLFVKKCINKYLVLYFFYSFLFFYFCFHDFFDGFVLVWLFALLLVLLVWHIFSPLQTLAVIIDAFLFLHYSPFYIPALFFFCFLYAVILYTIVPSCFCFFYL